MERSFAKEIESLKLGSGETFYGEGILAVTKALLQSGVSYVGGYQGAPVSHLIDVMVQARDEMAELGVHVEPCTNEASAAAMLGASIMYPVRGAVTWKSIVGTNVAADALSNLASPGVIGGALIIIGEDYGEGASVIQERTHAYAMKSAIWLMDPRPELACIVNCVEKSFELSEASNTPVMLELRIRACHVQGSFAAKNNIAPAISTTAPLAEPAPHNYNQLSHPPVTYAQEKRKYDDRLPAARAFIRENRLNEKSDGRHDQVGIIVQGGIYNALQRALLELGLADARGNCDLATVDVECRLPAGSRRNHGVRRRPGRRSSSSRKVSPNISSTTSDQSCGERVVTLRLPARTCCRWPANIPPRYWSTALPKFLRQHLPAVGNVLADATYADEVAELQKTAKELLGAPVPARPPWVLHRLPRTPLLCGAQIDRKGNRQGSLLGRYWMPLVRNVCAL